MTDPTVQQSDRLTVRRVLFVSHAYIDPANRAKLRALAARGVDVTVAVPQRWRDPQLGATVETAWERQSGVEVFPVPGRGRGGPDRFRYSGRALAALLRSKRPDLVQIEEEPSSITARQVVRAAGALGVARVLFTWNGAAGDPLRRWQRRRTLAGIQGAVAAGEEAAAAVRRDRPGLPVAIVPQFGVQVPSAPTHRQHRGLVIGSVGRLVRGKGLDTLLQALARNRVERWRLIVVGEGPERERLEALALELRLAARIRWSGALPAAHVAGLWAELDVLVLAADRAATRSELTGDLVLEAMAHEVAVVAAATGVLPELVGDAGLLVPPGDVERLAEALRRLGDDGIRRPLAQQARQRMMKHYSDDAIAERTLEFWKSIVTSGQ